MLSSVNEEHSLGLVQRFDDTAVPHEAKYRAKNRFGAAVSPAWAVITPAEDNVAPTISDVSATASGTTITLAAKVVDYEGDLMSLRYICRTSDATPTQAAWDAAPTFSSPQSIGGLDFATDYYLWIFAADALHYTLEQGATVSDMQTATTAGDNIAPSRVVGYSIRDAGEEKTTTMTLTALMKHAGEVTMEVDSVVKMTTNATHEVDGEIAAGSLFFDDFNRASGAPGANWEAEAGVQVYGTPYFGLYATAAGKEAFATATGTLTNCSVSYRIAY
jgi:hypothetical protein